MPTAILLVTVATFTVDSGSNRNPAEPSGLATMLAIFTILWSLVAGAVGYIVFIRGLGTCVLPCSFVGVNPSPAQFEAWQITGIVFVLTAFLLAAVAAYIIDPGLGKKAERTQTRLESPGV